MLNSFLTSLVFIAISCTALASTVEVDRESGGKQYMSKYGIRDDTVTRGRDLVGMVVTAAYLDGTTETTNWAHTRGAWGETNGANFGMIFGWRAFELHSTKTLASLTMDTRAANAVFDTLRSNEPGLNTYGTKGGYQFHIDGENDPEGDISVRYSRSFFIAGREHAIDAYMHMFVDFTGLEGGGLNGDLLFRTDLDSLEVAGDLSQVPLPATLLLFASALGITGAGIARKRAKQ